LTNEGQITTKKNKGKNMSKLISFDVGAGKASSKGFDIFPEGDCQGVCFDARPGSEMRTQKIDTKGSEDTPATGVKLKGWGHTHQNTETGKIFKDHGKDDFDWRECSPEYEFKFIQFFFCSASDYAEAYANEKPEFDENGNLKEAPKGAWIRSRKMTASAAANSALRNFLKNWGVEVPAPDAWDALKSFDISGETIGRAAKLNVIHAQGNKHTFANINTCHPA